MTDISLNTGTLLKTLRTEKNMSVTELAMHLGVSKAAISQWESGSGIKTEELYNLSKFFDISVAELIEGKLNSEPKENFWRRNYDLSLYDFGSDISDGNISEIKKYYQHYKMIYKRFYELLGKWSLNELSTDESEEFSYIKEYFEFDSSYYSYIKNGPGTLTYTNNNTEREFIKEITEKYSNDISEYKWQIEKLYVYKADDKQEAILKSNNVNAMEYYVDTLSQVGKDALFNANLSWEVEVEKDMSAALLGHVKRKETRHATIYDIETDPFYRILLNAGARCMLTYEGIQSGVDSDEFDKFQGKVIVSEPQQNENLNNLGLFMNAGGRSEIRAITYWKLYSLEDYNKSVDYKKTEYYKNIIRFKDSEPLKYYDLLLKNK